MSALLQRNLLFVAGDHTLQDCDIIEQGSVNDSDVIQDYKKENQHYPSKAANKKVRDPQILYFIYSKVPNNEPVL